VFRVSDHENVDDLDYKVSTHASLVASGYDSVSKLPSGSLLLCLFLETFALLLLLRSLLSLAVDARLEVFDVFLQQVTMLGVRDAKRLCTTDAHTDTHTIDAFLQQVMMKTHTQTHTHTRT